MAATSTGKRRIGWRGLEWAARLLVAGLFVYTGITKILDPDSFIEEVRFYEIAPVLVSNLIAYVLPWIELFSALLLVTGFWRLEARLVIAAMLLVFIAAKTYVIGILGKDLEACGCVPAGSPIHFLFDGWVGVLTNVCLLALLGIEAYMERLGRKPARVCEPVTA